MAKVLFMQNCFVPDDNQFGRLEKSIKSLADYMQNVNTDNVYMYALGGYVEQKYVERVKALVEELKDIDRFFQVLFYQISTNVGKGRCCNYVVNTFAKEQTDVDYLFMFDNDICFEDRPEDIVQMLIDQKTELDRIGKLKYPVIACNFKEHQVHNMGALDFGKKVIHGTMRASTGRFGCIGGGCWLVEKAHWDKIGGYIETAVYGLDDGKFYLDTIKQPDTMVALSEDIYVIHPSDTDQTYNLFKADTNVNRIRKMNYEELTEDMNNFWKDRK